MRYKTIKSPQTSLLKKRIITESFQNPSKLLMGKDVRGGGTKTKYLSRHGAQPFWDRNRELKRWERQNSFSLVGSRQPVATIYSRHKPNEITENATPTSAGSARSLRTTRKPVLPSTAFQTLLSLCWNSSEPHSTVKFWQLGYRER